MQFILAFFYQELEQIGYEMRFMSPFLSRLKNLVSICCKEFRPVNKANTSTSTLADL